jgi:hypothetical protein
MKNKLSDARNHIFMALERLNDESIEGEKLLQEIERAKAIKENVQVLVNSAKVEVDFIKTTGQRGSFTGFFPDTGQFKLD